jgi:imidazolonepropionase-like amidohydrolase
MPSLIVGATIIDGVAQNPIAGQSIWIEGGRIKAIGKRDEFGCLPQAELIDAAGKFVIPGLMNANVHLLCDVRLENLARYTGRYEELIAEAAQVALKNGLTTVFDTWGPRRFLMAVRDRINAGATPGSRIFCAGNIIGFDGPYSADFFHKAAEVASPAFVKRINAIWAENVGRHMMWLSPDQAAREVRTYIGKGIDFIKLASNEHFGTSAGAFLAFSPRVQAAMVEEAHRAGITAQAHTMSSEGLHVAIEAGCDLIQHANNTGPAPMSETMLEFLATRQTGAVVFPFTQRRLEWLMKNDYLKGPTMLQAADTNVRNLIRCGAMLLLANDGSLFAPEWAGDPLVGKSWAAPGEDSLMDLGTGHFAWLKAMEEKGMMPRELLKAATSNIAAAYGKDKDLGTLEPGKIADLLILRKNPLEAAENYRSIDLIVKEGVIVDRDALPLNPLLTRPMDPPAPEETSYVVVSHGTFPMCPMCVRH